MTTRTRALVISALTAGLLALVAAPANAAGIDVAGLILETPPI
ncbi:hypothetical protein [Streptomyces iconiensis]|uniref:Uncharacterized protein n=1 Tax=Streptomyces iconiensis TaxID=1384038 RepID=A0ABT7A174_9ACTN|nr:hypothetical protein [Streptomyces iconiensis]MDJ1134814.1 hypothetical protein [Streptomyces iconiensis]